MRHITFGLSAAASMDDGSGKLERRHLMMVELNSAIPSGACLLHPTLQGSGNVIITKLFHYVPRCTPLRSQCAKGFVHERFRLFINIVERFINSEHSFFEIFFSQQITMKMHQVARRILWVISHHGAM